MTISTKPNRAYPSLPDVGGTPESHTHVLRAMREAIEIHERRTGNYLDSFVRVRELIDLGLAQVQGTQILPVESSGGGGTTGIEFVTVPRGATWTDPSGAAVAAPAGPVFLYFPAAATITGVTITTLGGPGDCEIDIWKAPIGSFPPTVADSIVNGNYPAISADESYRDTSMTGWDTVAVDAGDVVALYLNSTSGDFTSIFVSLDFRVAA